MAFRSFLTIPQYPEDAKPEPGTDLLSRAIRAIVGTGWAQKYLREMLRWTWYFIVSETLSFIESFVWFGLGVFWIFGDGQDRPEGHSIMADGEVKKENTIQGFGQLVPIVLLGIPLMQVFEAYASHSADLAERKRKEALPRCLSCRGED